MKYPLLLGSASERRRKILTELGLDFRTVAPDVIEILHSENPERTALENAVNKHDWCRPGYPDYAVITADTVLDFRGRCMTKPDSLKQAVDFLRTLSAKTHTVITAVAMSFPHEDPEVVAVRSDVTFRTLDDAVIDDYFSRFNPLDRAGAYDIDEHGDMIIESFSGSYTNIMGLPVETVRRWLAGAPS